MSKRKPWVAEEKLQWIPAIWEQCGKQVLLNGKHFADAENEHAAELMLSALKEVVTYTPRWAV